MVEKAGRLEQSLNTLRRDGVAGLSRKVLLYLLRRVAWRSEEWTKRLDFAISRNSLLQEYGTVLKRNEVFRNRHRGQRCFVIGNGPSLRRQDLSPLGDEITLVVNNFHVHPIIGESWQPNYYFLSDPQYFDGTVDLSEFSALTSHIRSTPFFVPHYARKFLLKSNALPVDRTYYVAECGGMEDKWCEKPDLTRVTPGVQTVPQLAIMAAMYLGCSPIYLLGLDHDWLAHGGEHINFYGELDAESQPDGNLPGWTYKSMMAAVATMWQIYEMLLRIARAEGIKIVNATHGGFLDVFERGNYEEIIMARLPEAQLPSAK